MTKKYKPGIYFGMPFEEYIQIDAMNNGGIKNLLISPLDYWARTPMNPVCGEIDEETVARNDGRVYHKRILEGKEEFYKVYAPDFECDPNDKTILCTSDEIKYALIKKGLGGGFKTKTEGAARLLSCDPKARIRHVMEAQHRDQHKGKELVSAALIRNVELQSKVIEFHPELRTWLAGGYPEVTVIWYDEELGIMFKVRFDYMKLQFGVDLKSFANQMKKNIDRAIANQIASYRYHIQGALYKRGHAAAKHLAAEGLVHGKVDKKWLKDFARYETEDFRFIFAQKGPAPVAKGRIMRHDCEAERQGLVLIREAVTSYHVNLKQFGTSPWIDLSPPESIEFSELGSYVNDL